MKPSRVALAAVATTVAGVVAGLGYVAARGRTTLIAELNPSCSLAGYNRSRQFGHEPSTATRVAVAARQANVDGTITDPYTHINHAGPAGLDADHIVPLDVAWKRGANCWPREERAAFARDIHYLVLVNAHDNRSKGARTLDQWQPDNDPCGYARQYLAALVFYRLPITPAEDATATRVCTP
jgi:hypothetical protein